MKTIAIMLGIGTVLLSLLVIRQVRQARETLAESARQLDKELDTLDARTKEIEGALQEADAKAGFTGPWVTRDVPGGSSTGEPLEDAGTAWKQTTAPADPLKGPDGRVVYGEIKPEYSRQDFILPYTLHVGTGNVLDRNDWLRAEDEPFPRPPARQCFAYAGNRASYFGHIGTSVAILYGEEMADEPDECAERPLIFMPAADFEKLFARSGIMREREQARQRAHDAR